MKLTEMARWHSLIEAVELIASKCMIDNIDIESRPEKLEKYLKPCYIEKYICARHSDVVTLIEDNKPNAMQVLGLKK